MIDQLNCPRMIDRSVKLSNADFIKFIEESSNPFQYYHNRALKSPLLLNLLFTVYNIYCIYICMYIYNK